MAVRELLADYERVLCIDADAIVLASFPDLFDIVPEELIGTVLEDVGSRKGRRRQTIAAANAAWGEFGWRTGYINTGLFMVSRLHAPIFDVGPERFWDGWGADDVTLGWQINRMGFGIHSLPWEFNFMCMFSEPWNGYADRFGAHVIHYAGGATFPSDDGTPSRKGLKKKAALIRRDLKRIRE